jgi:signal transduction histidine kinase/ActR/RegA family two-component response regulator
MIPLLMGGMVLAYFPSQMQASAQQVSEQRVLSLVRVTKAAAEPGFEFNDASFMTTSLAPLARDPDILYAVVLGQDGEALAQLNDASYPPLPSTLARDEIGLHVSLPMTANDERRATLQIGVSERALNAQVSANKRRAAIITLLVTLTSIMAAWLIATIIVGPISKLQEAAHHLSRGEWRIGRSLLNTDVPTTTRNEVMGLTHSLSQMADSLERQAHDLERANDVLEEQVATKTESLEVALLRAKTAARAKGTFLANMSHEIRTPMNGVLGLVDLLLDTRIDADQRSMLNTVRFSGQALVGIINDILDYSRLESGKLELAPHHYSPQMLLDSVTMLLRPQIEAKGLVLNLESPPLPAVLIGDSFRLRQVVLNLLSNALKFTHEGSVNLRVDVIELGEECHFRISVRDTGVGIAPEQMDRLFTSFSQADSSTAREFGGSGLGLSISQNLLTLMGSIISVKSTFGQGSTFSFELVHPVGEEQLPAVATDTRKLSFNGRVLVVEDNMVNQIVVKRMLERVHITPDIVQNGAEAIEAAIETRYDLILMDCSMPVIDGFEATLRLRRDHGCQTPIVALTANAMQGDRERCIRAGMNDYLSKPIAADSLHAVLVRWLPEHEDLTKGV